MRGHRSFHKKEQPHKINKEITSLVVRIIIENGESKIVSLKEALELANQLDLDLVEISPQTNPPVCKIMDYQKFLYNLKKKQKDIKAKTAKVTIKEIRLGPNTDDHDFNFKVKHAIGFLEEGNKVKVDVFFKGRSIMYKEQGEEMLMRFAKACEEVGKPDQMPKLEGKRMILILSPKK
ncbi:MAG: translation initiation factor IF-3 [Bacteroidales bacterium]|jgi:translation initiation factor IF-3|nr:translation initiation factor IF-3 [Bacteroidales bacterium]MDD4209099.1 translation initiation factor IF-3 [Bacteroidales bacterium]MDY0015341.1 translation initiation factor IF-3 [Bacteroidales bacterium]